MRIHRTSVSGYQTVGRAVSGFLVLLLLGLISCSESTQPTTGLDSTHGAIAVSVYVKQDVSGAAPTTSVLAAASNPPIDCVSLGIGVITIQAQDSGGTVRGSGDFGCLAHEGTLTGIPAGPGYTVTVIGRAFPNGPNLLQGKMTGITVTPNSTVSASVGLNRIPLPWDKKNPENVAVSVAPNSQINPSLAPDGSGGAIIVWQDNREGTVSGIYAQRLNNQGLPRWRTNGVPIDTNTPTATQRNPKVVGDNVADNGLALVVWEDARMDESDLYLGRVSFSGESIFSGTPIVQAPNAQKNQQIISDGTGESILVWEDTRNGTANIDIYAQRLDQVGFPQWITNGRAVSQEVHDQKNPQLISAGDGGAIIVWEDTRNGTANIDIYAQRIDALGAPIWRVNGVIQDVAVSQAPNNQTLPQLVSDGAGGAIIVWQDERTEISGVYAQRLNSAGVTQWSANGVVVKQNSGEFQRSFQPKLVSDDAKGAIIGWLQEETIGLHFAQRLSESGALVWPSDVPVCLENLFVEPRLVSDRAGGAIFTCSTIFFSGTTGDIYAQRVNSDGVVQWGGFGVAVNNAGEEQSNPGIVEDGTGGAIIAWQDFRTGKDSDIYAQGILATGVQ